MSKRKKVYNEETVILIPCAFIFLWIQIFSEIPIIVANAV